MEKKYKLCQGFLAGQIFTAKDFWQGYRTFLF